MSQPSNYPLRLHPTPLILSREDNWQGISNTSERRRIQNRINQRTRRSRRRNEAKVSTDGSRRSTNANVVQTDLCLASRSPLATSIRQVDYEKIIAAINIRDPECWENHSLVRAFEAFVYDKWLVRAPMPALLPSLVRFNFARAIMANAKILGLTYNELDDEAISSFNLEGPWPPGRTLEIGTLPTELQPTDLQRRTLHHPWLDLIPIPNMRDNLLRRGVECFDEDELCCAMVGHSAGFIVWGDAWDSCGWEVTEGFAQSPWGWTIAGCWELYQSTNKWRAQRGEPPLFPSTTIYNSDNTYHSEHP
ncbi:hypothetical protein F4803DRAFT_535964 [Xylaria telfairii]|nr:hypothetical protein F4803DRAFT_535964 [Xylaria telfairii]